MGLREDGSEIDLTGSTIWNTTDGVAAVSADGVLFGQRAGMGTLTAKSMNLSYEVPVTVVEPGAIAAAFSGTWSGTTLMTACRVITVTASGSCAGLGQSNPWRAVLKVSEESIDGSLTMYNLGAIGPVKGLSAVDGALWLAGRLEAADQGNVMVILRSRFTLSGDSLEGTMTMDRKWRNFFGLIHQREERQVTALRQAG